MSVNRGVATFLVVSLMCWEKIWCFESLLDNDLYSISWKGPVNLPDDDDDTKPLSQDSVIIMTNNNEKYQCILPVVDIKTRSKFQESISSAKLELEFLRGMLDSKNCDYRLEIYWTYEFCHGRHIRQYHEEKGAGNLPVVQEYYLGRYNREQFNQDLNAAKEKRNQDSESHPPIVKVDGMDLPYYEVIYDSGTNCDLTDIPRRSRVLYVCYPESKGEIYELKETSTCEYEIVILTSALCQHPSYGPRKDPVHIIDCHSIEDAPRRPLSLEAFELQSTMGGYQEQEISDAIRDVVNSYIKEEKGKLKAVENEPKPEPKGDLRQATSSETHFKGQPSARQVIADFFKGDYCIQGGSGWWRHEFCFGKFIRQFHEDHKGRSTIILGVWEEEKHVEWLQKNPSKKPKPLEQRKSVTNFYSNGAVCHETGKPRSVEVRFNCLVQPESSGAISLYLIENVLCEYKLIVEAPLFCDVIQKADNNGVFQLDL